MSWSMLREVLKLVCPPHPPTPRKHHRYATTELRCSLGRVEDISMSGVRVSGEGKSPVRRGMALELVVSDEEEHVKVPVRVAWVRRPRHGAYEIGLEFVGAKREQIEGVSRLACQASQRVREANRAGHSAQASVEIEDLYGILGVESAANDSEIRAAFRKLARECHPDHSTAPDAAAKFTLISKAYRVMKDPEMRRRYDAMRLKFKAA